MKLCYYSIHEAGQLSFSSQISSKHKKYRTKSSISSLINIIYDQVSIQNPHLTLYPKLSSVRSSEKLKLKTVDSKKTLMKTEFGTVLEHLALYNYFSF